MAADGRRHDRELLEAGGRRDPRHRAGRRARGRARLPLSRRRPVGEAGHARGQARPASGRRRDAAAAARRGGPQSARNVRDRQSDRRQGRVRMRAGRPLGRRRAHPARGGLCGRGARYPPAAQIVRAAGPAGRRRPGPVRCLPQGQCEAIPRLRRAAEEYRGGQGRDRKALFRRRDRRAQIVHGADERRAIGGAAIFLLRRAQGRQDRRPARGHRAAPDPQGRRDRRRHDGRRHLDEFPVGRHSGDDRRDGPGRARPRHRR